MNNDCLKYWNLCPNISITAAVALWCNVEPGQLAGLGYSTGCMDAKREVIEQSIIDGRLEYTSTSTWRYADLRELFNKDQIRIDKESLKMALCES
ncbi:MAG: hypothetical protein WCP66_12660 [Methylococcales bacterium]